MKSYEDCEDLGYARKQAEHHSKAALVNRKVATHMSQKALEALKVKDVAGEKKHEDLAQQYNQKAEHHEKSFESAHRAIDRLRRKTAKKEVLETALLEWMKKSAPQAYKRLNGAKNEK